MFTKRIDDDLYLRLMDTYDAEELFQLIDHSRNYLREWLPWVDETKTVSDSQSFIQFSKKLYGESVGMNCAIIYQEKMAGIIGYNSVDWKNKIVYIGYWLGEGFQGKGIMTKAVEALIDYAFNELNLNKIDIRAATDNQKSRAIPERLGFVREGTIRQGEWLYNQY